jgi:hypothetical protein
MKMCLKTFTFEDKSKLILYSEFFFFRILELYIRITKLCNESEGFHTGVIKSSGLLGRLTL